MNELLVTPQCKGEDNMPVGMVLPFAGNGSPDGDWLLCDGSAISRNTYRDLFNTIGTLYGEGDGSTTFNLPNLTAKFIEGSSTSGNVKEAGLPNLTGEYGNNFDLPNESRSLRLPFWSKQTGVFSGTDARRTTHYNSISSNTSTDTCWGVVFDASKSNAIYGNSETVQPPAITMRYFIHY